MRMWRRQHVDSPRLCLGRWCLIGYDWWDGGLAFPCLLMWSHIYMIVRLVRCYRTYTRLPDTYMVAIRMQGCQVYTGLSYIFRVAKHIHGCHSWTVLLDNLSLDLLNVTGSSFLHNLLAYNMTSFTLNIHIVSSVSVERNDDTAISYYTIFNFFMKNSSFLNKSIFGPIKRNGF